MVEKTIDRFGIAFSGFFFAIQPEIGIILFLIFALHSLYTTQFNVFFQVLKGKNQRIIGLIILFVFFRIVLALRNNNIWVGLLEALAVCTMLICGLYLSSYQYKNVNYGIVFGILLSILLVLFLRTTAFSGDQLQWQENSSRSVQKKTPNTIIFHPVHAESAWFGHEFSPQGPGKVRYEIEIRAKSPFRTTIFLIHPSISSGRMDAPCQVSTQWGKCSVEVMLSVHGWVTAGVGGSSGIAGSAAWKLGSPDLEVRNPRFPDAGQLRFIDTIINPWREKGFTFNENAFGILSVVSGLLAIGFFNLPMGILTSFFTLFTIFLSGSRGALVAFLVGLVVLLLMRSRWYKMMPFLFAMFFMGLAVYQVNILRSDSKLAAETPLRALAIADQGATRIRFEIWRLTLEAWLETPSTFVFGVGNLSSRIQSKFDARASSFGLQKQDLTHAHNLWLQIAGESGIFGLVVFVLLWVGLVFRAFRSRDSVVLGLLVAIFLSNSVDYLFFYGPVQFSFWICVFGIRSQIVSHTKPIPINKSHATLGQ